MADDGVGVTDNAPGAGIADIHTRVRTVGGSSRHEQYVIPIEERVISFSGFANTFRIPARAAASEPLATIWNASATTLVAVQAILLDTETIVAKTVINPVVHAYRMTSAPSNGTAVTKVGTDTAQSSDASVTLLQDASADGTNSASALTLGTLGTQFSGRFVPRMHTAVGTSPSQGSPANLLRDQNEYHPHYLRQTQGIAIRADAAAALTAGDFHYEITIIWDEFTLP